MARGKTFFSFLRPRVHQRRAAEDELPQNCVSVAAPDLYCASSLPQAGTCKQPVHHPPAQDLAATATSQGAAETAPAAAPAAPAGAHTRDPAAAPSPTSPAAATAAAAPPPPAAAAAAGGAAADPHTGSITEATGSEAAPGATAAAAASSAAGGGEAAEDEAKDKKNPTRFSRFCSRMPCCRWGSFALAYVAAFAALTGLLMGYDMCIVAVVLDPVDRHFNLCGDKLSCGAKTLFVSILAPGAVVRTYTPNPKP